MKLRTYTQKKLQMEMKYICSFGLPKKMYLFEEEKIIKKTFIKNQGMRNAV